MRCLDTSIYIWYKMYLMNDGIHKSKKGLRGALLVVGIILILSLGTWLVGTSMGILSSPTNTSLSLSNFSAISLWSINPWGGKEKAPTSLPDFKTIIIATGIVDTITNEFVETATFNKNDRGAVRFRIINVGDIASPEWQFNVLLPTFPFYIYLSDIQKPLNPNEEKIYTLFFDQVIGSPMGTIEINADPTGVIEELIEKNNIARALIIVTE